MGFAASLIGPAISVVGGVLSKKSKKKQAAGLAASGEEATRQLQPYAEAGGKATDLISNILAGGGGADEAFKRFQEGTGFQSMMQEGSNAITGNAAARGLLNSGSTLKRLTSFAQNRAQSSFADFTGLAERQARTGAGAAGSTADVIMNTGARVAKASGEGDDALISGIGKAGAALTGPVSNFLKGL